MKVGEGRLKKISGSEDLKLQGCSMPNGSSPSFRIRFNIVINLKCSGNEKNQVHRMCLACVAGGFCSYANLK